MVMAIMAIRAILADMAMDIFKSNMTMVGIPRMSAKKLTQ